MADPYVNHTELMAGVRREVISSSNPLPAVYTSFIGIVLLSS
jgi:hypothetical protein